MRAERPPRVDSTGATAPGAVYEVHDDRPRRSLDAGPANRAERRCGICGGPVERPDGAPFCSPRCQLADLSRWLDGSYRIPIEDRSSSFDADDPTSGSEEP